MLIQECIRLYHEPKHSLPAPTLSFRDYVLAEASLHTSALYQGSRQYWQEHLSSLPPAPDLPLADAINRVPTLGESLIVNSGPDDLTVPRNLLPSVGAQFHCARGQVRHGNNPPRTRT